MTSASVNGADGSDRRTLRICTDEGKARATCASADVMFIDNHGGGVLRLRVSGGCRHGGDGGVRGMCAG